jgi:hypothetical protein
MKRIKEWLIQRAVQHAIKVAPETSNPTPEPPSVIPKLHIPDHSEDKPSVRVFQTYLRQKIETDPRFVEQTVDRVRIWLHQEP